MSQPAESTITVSTPDGLTITVESSGPITITPPVTPPPVTATARGVDHDHVR